MRIIVNWPDIMYLWGIQIQDWPSFIVWRRTPIASFVFKRQPHHLAREGDVNVAMQLDTKMNDTTFFTYRCSMRLASTNYGAIQLSICLEIVNSLGSQLLKPLRVQDVSRNAVAGWQSVSRPSWQTLGGRTRMAMAWAIGISAVGYDLNQQWNQSATCLKVPCAHGWWCHLKRSWLQALSTQSQPAKMIYMQLRLDLKSLQRSTQLVLIVEKPC